MSMIIVVVIVRICSSNYEKCILFGKHTLNSLQFIIFFYFILSFSQRNFSLKTLIEKVKYYITNIILVIY